MTLYESVAQQEENLKDELDDLKRLIDVMVTEQIKSDDPFWFRLSPMIKPFEIFTAHHPPYYLGISVNRNSLALYDATDHCVCPVEFYDI